MAGSSLPFHLLLTLWWQVLAYHSSCYLLYDGRFWFSILLVIYFMMAGFSFPFFLLFTLWWQVSRFPATTEAKDEWTPWLTRHVRCCQHLQGVRWVFWDGILGHDFDKRLDSTSKEFGEYTEMKFLYVILAKDSSLLLHAIHSLVYRRIFQKILLYSGVKTQLRKISSLFMNSIL